MKFPGRKELAATDPYAGVARGAEITADVSRHGVIDDGNVNWPERVDLARRIWPESSADAYEQLDRRGRRWCDRASGREYTAADGAPLLAIGGEECRGIVTWFQLNGRIVFLRPVEFSDVIAGAAAYVVGREVSPDSPPDDAVRIR